MYVARGFASDTNVGEGFTWLDVCNGWEIFPWGSLAPVVQPCWGKHSSVVAIHIKVQSLPSLMPAYHCLK